MSHILVIFSFILAYFMSHAVQPLVPGGSHADNCLSALQAESKYYPAENPDTDFTFPGAGAENPRTDLPVADAPTKVLAEQPPFRIHRVQIMHLDLPPPVKS